MFVQSNQLKDLLNYYQQKLAHHYKANEIEQFFYLMAFFVFKAEKIDVRTKEIRLSESELLTQREIVKQLIAGRPIQYILGKVEFYGLVLSVDQSVLIPRPETEELVDLILSRHKNNSYSIIDIGTGSGCIPLALKAHRPSWSINAIDVSETALNTAQKNSSQLNLPVNWIQKNILNDDLGELGKVDLIVSNPPYVLESDKTEMTKTVLDFEPSLALFVLDTTPLLFYNRIITIAQTQLKKGGALYFEIHESFGKQIIIALKTAGFNQIELVQDMQGKDRIVFGTLG